MIPLHESILTQFRAILQLRLLEEQFLKEYGFDELRWDGEEVIAYRGYPPMAANDPDTSVRAADFETGSAERRAFGKLKREFRKAERMGSRLAITP